MRRLLGALRPTPTRASRCLRVIGSVVPWPKQGGSCCCQSPRYSRNKVKRALSARLVLSALSLRGVVCRARVATAGLSSYRRIVRCLHPPGSKAASARCSTVQWTLRVKSELRKYSNVAPRPRSNRAGHGDTSRMPRRLRHIRSW
jgi:hypothetical protein